MGRATSRGTRRHRRGPGAADAERGAAGVPATTPRRQPAPSAAARADAGCRPAATARSRRRRRPRRRRPGRRRRNREPAKALAGRRRAACARRRRPHRARACLAAAEDVAACGCTVADAEARLGYPASHDLGTHAGFGGSAPVAPDSLPTVRQQYVVSGVPCCWCSRPARTREMRSPRRRATRLPPGNGRIEAAGRARRSRRVAATGGFRPCVGHGKPGAVLFELEGRCRPTRSTR